MVRCINLCTIPWHSVSKMLANWRLYFRASAGYYGRQVNPTVSALENKITAMEQGVASVCFGTGMAAIGTTMPALLRAGDHVVSSAFLFGNTTSLFNSFDRQGLNISFVDATNVDNVANAITAETKMVFVETIANRAHRLLTLKQSESCASSVA